MFARQLAVARCFRSRSFRYWVQFRRPSLAPAGRVCQFSVRTTAGPVDFAPLCGERCEVAGIVPYSDKYCACDPGPVTPDSRRPG
jgi:hypothetical protein